MWSKLLIYFVAAVFVMAVGTGVMAHDGRISNLIEDPSETDEHPWGGENQASDDPIPFTSSGDNTIIKDRDFLFVRLSMPYSWISVRFLIWEILDYGDTNIGTKKDSGTTPIPLDNNVDITDQGTR